MSKNNRRRFFFGGKQKNEHLIFFPSKSVIILSLHEKYISSLSSDEDKFRNHNHLKFHVAVFKSDDDFEFKELKITFFDIFYGVLSSFVVTNLIL